FGAKDEAAFDQLGHDVYSLSALQHGAGSAESRVAPQMIDHAVGVVQQLGAVVGMGGTSEGKRGQGGGGGQFGQGLEHGTILLGSNTGLKRTDRTKVPCV